MSQTDIKRKFTVRFYFISLTRLLGEPRRFFSELPHDLEWRQSFGFLVVSSLFFTGASLVSNIYQHPVVTGVIFFSNALGMAMISSAFGYLLMTMIMGRFVTFNRFFNVYAFSSGLTLLASWIPFFTWLTEPWKWCLVGIGMVRYCSFSCKQAVLVIMLSLSVLILFFLSALPLLSFLKT